MAALMNVAIYIVVLCCCCYCFRQGNYSISLVSMEGENFHNSAASSSIFLAISTLRSLLCWKHYAVTSLTAATNHGYSSLVYLCTNTWQGNYKTSSSYIVQESKFLERSIKGRLSTLTDENLILILLNYPQNGKLEILDTCVPTRTIGKKQWMSTASSKENDSKFLAVVDVINLNMTGGSINF